jgi:hypothetical protein
MPPVITLKSSKMQESAEKTAQTIKDFPKQGKVRLTGLSYDKS